MRILMITNTIPYPLLSGGAVRVYNLLKRISHEHQIWLATNLETPDQAEGIAPLKSWCEDVVTGCVRRQSPAAHLPGLARYALAGWPLELKFRHSAELADKITDLTNAIPFDLVQIEESRMALYLEILPPGTKCLLTFYDVAFDQAARMYPLERTRAMRSRMWLYSRMMRRWEPNYAARFARAITVSTRDRDLLRATNPSLKIDVVPNGVDTLAHQPLAAESTAPSLLFVGNMSYLPCVDAALYLIREILPRIRQQVPDVEVWIVGANPTAEIKHLAGDRVHVTGRVPDIRPYYALSRVCVVPLRAGGGTRLKILEAMALGRAIVSTHIGCEGLDLVDGEHLLVADAPAQFAAHAITLLKDEDRYRIITAHARQAVESCYDWDAIAMQMLHIYEDECRSN
jgi:polysaccharide biosynthesis protein PslH